MMNQKTYKGIIFDLDGVLLSTDHFHYLAWKSMADELEIPFNEQDNEKLRGVSRMESLEIILSNRPELVLSEEEKLHWTTRKNDLYRTYLETLTPDAVDPSVRETLVELRRRGYRLAVGSSSKNTKFILSQTDMNSYFDAVADGNDIQRSKPDPEVFLLAAARLGLDGNDCAVIEDAEAGIAAACAGGMLPVAIGSACESPMAKVLLKMFGDLADIFA